MFHTRTLSLLLLTLFVGGCEWVSSRFAAQPGITYVTAGENFADKPDLARVEYEHPITLKELAKITPAYLSKRTQEELDQIYARLAAGPMPDGPFNGSIVFTRGSSGKFRIAEVLGGLKGLAAQFKVKKLEVAGEALWKGKVFYREQKVLRNRIEDLAILRPIMGEGELQKISVDGRDAWLLFPAKLYCGQSLIDSRRESIIIDYAFTDEIPGYREKPDFLAGRNGLKVRDEIRMIRPGLYLGRAYMDRVFLLNFILESPAQEKAGKAEFEAGQIKQDCWVGSQPRVALR